MSVLCCIVSDTWTPVQLTGIWIVKVYAHSYVINVRFLALENLLMSTVPCVSNCRSNGSYTHLKLASQTLVPQRLKRWGSVSSPAGGKGDVLNYL